MRKKTVAYLFYFPYVLYSIYTKCSWKKYRNSLSNVLTVSLNQWNVKIKKPSLSFQTKNRPFFVITYFKEVPSRSTPSHSRCHHPCPRSLISEALPAVSDRSASRAPLIRRAAAATALKGIINPSLSWAAVYIAAMSHLENSISYDSVKPMPTNDPTELHVGWILIQSMGMLYPKQDSWAIAKKTTRCAQYMGALKSFESPHYAPDYFSRNL